MKGYLHLLPISKKWEIRYDSNSFTTTCLPVISEQQDAFTKKDHVKKFEFDIVNILGVNHAKILNPKKNEILVFESDEFGYHNTPTSILAKEQYGAEEGFGCGLKGNSYAIPTLDMFQDKISMDDIIGYISKFIDYTKKCKSKSFKVINIGMEKYGMSEDESKMLLRMFRYPKNVELIWR